MMDVNTIYTSVIFRLEYLYESIMEYLRARYHNYHSSLPDVYLPPETLADIGWGASYAASVAYEHTGYGSGGAGDGGAGDCGVGYGNVVY